MQRGIVRPVLRATLDPHFSLDFGVRQQISEMSLRKALIVKCRGELGRRQDMGDVSEIMVLHRIVQWVTRTATDRDRTMMETES